MSAGMSRPRLMACGARSQPVGSKGHHRRHRTRHSHVVQRFDWPISASGRDRGRPRRSGASRGYRLAADLGVVWLAQAHVRQSDGHAQSRNRRGHGARSCGGTRPVESPRRGPTNGWPPSPHRCSRPPARDGWGSCRGHWTLPGCSRPDDKHSGTELPHNAGEQAPSPHPR